MHWLMGLIIVAGLPPQPATHPGFVDAAQLNAVCHTEGPDSAATRALCLGYVTGAVDQILARTGSHGPPTLCPPADLTPKAVLEAVLRYDRFAATAQGFGAADFVRFALEEAYPCPVERSPR